ncbi:unnamed protein product [Amoebophrya sp. A120]|nr:unnamed protein product [Amoebophrya sp. A120]|eukprot:GSA120T00010543001.1
MWIRCNFFNLLLSLPYLNHIVFPHTEDHYEHNYRRNRSCLGALALRVRAGGYVAARSSIGARLLHDDTSSKNLPEYQYADLRDRPWTGSGTRTTLTTRRDAENKKSSSAAGASTIFAGGHGKQEAGHYHDRPDRAVRHTETSDAASVSHGAQSSHIAVAVIPAHDPNLSSSAASASRGEDDEQEDGQNSADSSSGDDGSGSPSSSSAEDSTKDGGQQQEEEEATQGDSDSEEEPPSEQPADPTRCFICLENDKHFPLLRHCARCDSRVHSHCWAGYRAASRDFPLQDSGDVSGRRSLLAYQRNPSVTKCPLCRGYCLGLFREKLALLLPKDADCYSMAAEAVHGSNAKRPNVFHAILLGSADANYVSPPVVNRNFRSRRSARYKKLYDKLCGRVWRRTDSKIPNDTVEYLTTVFGGLPSEDHFPQRPAAAPMQPTNLHLEQNLWKIHKENQESLKKFELRRAEKKAKQERSSPGCPRWSGRGRNVCCRKGAATCCTVLLTPVKCCRHTLCFGCCSSCSFCARNCGVCFCEQRPGTFPLSRTHPHSRIFFSALSTRRAISDDCLGLFTIGSACVCSLAAAQTQPATQQLACCLLVLPLGGCAGFLGPLTCCYTMFYGAQLHQAFRAARIEKSVASNSPPARQDFASVPQATESNSCWPLHRPRARRQQENSDGSASCASTRGPMFCCCAAPATDDEKTRDSEESTRHDDNPSHVQPQPSSGPAAASAPLVVTTAEAPPQQVVMTIQTDHNRNLRRASSIAGLGENEKFPSVATPTPDEDSRRTILLQDMQQSLYDVDLEAAGSRHSQNPNQHLNFANTKNNEVEKNKAFKTFAPYTPAFAKSHNFDGCAFAPCCCCPFLGAGFYSCMEDG